MTRMGMTPRRTERRIVVVAMVFDLALFTSSRSRILNTAKIERALELNSASILYTYDVRKRSHTHSSIDRASGNPVAGSTGAPLITSHLLF